MHAYLHGHSYVQNALFQPYLGHSFVVLLFTEDAFQYFANSIIFIIFRPAPNVLQGTH